MHGLKRYFIKNGLSTAAHPIVFQMSAPNYDQNAPQEYAIVIEIKK